MGIRDAVSAMTLKVNYDGKEAERGMGELKKLVAGAFTIYAAKQVLDYSVGLAKMGMAANITEKSFNKMVNTLGGDSKQMIDDMKKATMNMVDDSDLMGLAFKGMMAKINFKDMKVAMEFASKYAISTGQNFNDVYEQIMSSFMRNTARGLKGLGLDVGESKNIVRDAVLQMQSKMKDFAVDMNDPIVKQQQLKAEWQATREQIGKDLIPAYTSLLGVLSLLAKATGKVSEAFSAMGSSLGEAIFTKNQNAQQVLIGLTNKQIQQLNEMAREKLKDKDLDEATKLGIINIIALREKELALREKINQKLPGALTPEGLPNLGKGTDKTSSFAQRGSEEERKRAAEEAQKMRLDQFRNEVEIGKQILEARQKNSDKEKEEAEKRKKIEEGYAKEQLADRIEYGNLFSDIQLRLMQDTKEGRIEILTKQYEEEKAILENFNVDTTDLTAQFENNKTKIYQDEFTKRIGYAQEWISTVSDLTNGLQTLSDARTAREIRNLDKQHLSERQYAQKRKQIEEEAEGNRRKYARAQQLIAAAEATSNTALAATGAMSQTPGPVWVRILAAVAAAAAGAIQVATIEAQNFANGRGLVDLLSNGRNADTIQARIGKGEYIMPADRTAQNIDDLEAIRKGTNAPGTKAGGTVNQYFYSVPLESMIQVTKEVNRRNLSTARI